MDSKFALARRLVADFHGAAAAERAEAEWRRVHQGRQVPSDLPEKTIAPGRHKPHQVLLAAGLCASSSEGVRLLRQNAVKLDGAVVQPGQEIDARPGQTFVISVGPSRFVRVRVEAGLDREPRPT